MGSSGHDADAARASARIAAGHRYPKTMRLRRRQEYLAVQKTGRVFHGRYFMAVVAPSGASHDCDTDAPRAGRVGITVSKKVGKAVVRNRIKRMVREYVRNNQWLPSGRDVVIIAKRSASALPGYGEVAIDLASLASRLGSSARRQSRDGSSRC